MKLGMLVLAFAIAAAPALALADDDRPRKAHKHKHKKKKGALKRMKRFMKAIERFDADGDGKLSEDEVGDRFARLRRFDHNGDGWVTAGEMFRGKVR
jgi:hypothetical protein